MNTESMEDVKQKVLEFINVLEDKMMEKEDFLYRANQYLCGKYDVKEGEFEDFVFGELLSAYGRYKNTLPKR